MLGEADGERRRGKLERRVVHQTFQIRMLERLLTFLLCVFFYYPFFLFGMMMIYIGRLKNKIKIWTGLGFKPYGKLGHISRKHPIWDVVDVATVEELEFMRHRSPSYLYRMSMWTAREVSKFILRGQSVSLISEQDLVYSILFGVYSHSVTWEEESKMYRMKMEGFDDFFLFRGFYWDAREIWFDEGCTKMKIVFTHDREVSWPCKESEMAEWKLAKLHAQVCMTYYAPGLSHNHVHFVFPSSFILVVKRYLKPSSFLYRLLEPHMRFTERINYQALNVGKATNNKRSVLDRHFFFWQAIPITVEQFVEGVAKKCYRHYHTKFKQHTKQREEDPSLPLHCNFPPPYVQNKNLQRIPYFHFLASYYKVIEDFVTSVSHLIDDNDWQRVITILANHVPGIELLGKVDVITTFIHQVAVVHYCDHETFLRFFGRQYGCMCIRTPYEPWSNVYHWDTVVGDIPTVKHAKEFKENPMRLVYARDVMRTRCFQNVFVDFIADWSLDLRLISTTYNIDPVKEKEAADAIDDFKLAMKDLNSRLSQEEPPIVVPLVPAEKVDLNVWEKGSVGVGVHGRATNMQIIPVENFVRAVCF